ncbi:MAG: endonuclease V [Saprospiraceae bacterium]|nr:endonuclease V [Saprospiraceae bacterium]
MMNLEALQEKQKRMAKLVVVPPSGKGYLPKDEDIIFSLDIQYVGEDAYVAVDIQSYAGRKWGVYAAQTKAGMEYIPRYFCFREGPPLAKTIRKVIELSTMQPSLLIVDGHGIAHPRKFGVASWLGVELAIPSIGVAKRTLLPYETSPALFRGSSSPISLDDERVGSVLRTQDYVKPVFVSTGHQISLENTEAIILKLSSKYRVSEPIRRADHIARVYAKGETDRRAIFLGTLEE